MMPALLLGEGACDHGKLGTAICRGHSRLRQLTLIYIKVPYCGPLYSLVDKADLSQNCNGIRLP